MCNTKQDIVDRYWKDELQNVRSKYKRIKNERANLLSKLPEDLAEPFYVGSNIMYSLWLRYPYDKKLIGEVIERFEKGGWEVRWSIRENNTEDRSPLIGCEHTGTTAMVEFDATIPGTTCVRKEVGKITKEVPVYEYVCTEGEAEGLENPLPPLSAPLSSGET